MDVTASCPGGLCSGCGKPAVAALAEAYLTNNENCPSSVNQIGMSASHRITCMSQDEENRFLLELVETLSKARDSSEKFASTMKRARKRSTDAKRAMIISNTLTGTRPRDDIRFDLSFQKKIELAQAELRHLDSVRLSFGQAETVVGLQDTSNKLNGELDQAQRKLRQLRTENSRREKELDKITKSPVDVTRMEDSLRRELYSIRSRNSNLQKSIESSEDALETCLEIESKLRQELEALRSDAASSRSSLHAAASVGDESLTERQSVLEEEIKGLKAEREELKTKLDTMRESNVSKLVELELIVKSIKESKKSEECPATPPVMSPRTVNASIEKTPVQISPPLELASPFSLKDLEYGARDVRHVESLLLESENSECLELESDLPHKSSLVSVIEPFSLPVSPTGLECHTQFIPIESGIGNPDDEKEDGNAYAAASAIPDETLHLMDTHRREEEAAVEQLLEETTEIEREVQELEQEEETELEVPEAHFEQSDSVLESSSQNTSILHKGIDEQEAEEVDSCVTIVPRRLFQSTAVTQEDVAHLGTRVSPERKPLINVPRIFLISSRTSSLSAPSSIN